MGCNQDLSNCQNAHCSRCLFELTRSKVEFCTADPALLPKMEDVDTRSASMEDAQKEFGNADSEIRERIPCVQTYAPRC